MLSGSALIAQLGERQTEDLKAECSIHSQGILFFFQYLLLSDMSESIFLRYVASWSRRKSMEKENR